MTGVVEWVSGIVFNPAVPEAAYFPGPGFWRSGQLGAGLPGVATSGITRYTMREMYGPSP